MKKRKLADRQLRHKPEPCAHISYHITLITVNFTDLRSDIPVVGCTEKSEKICVGRSEVSFRQGQVMAAGVKWLLTMKLKP